MHTLSSAAMIEPAALRPAEFEQIRRMAHRVSGLDLRPGKEPLVSARLGRRVRELGLGGIGEYLAAVENDRTGSELACLIDALTTNFTSFLREARHFELLKATILPELAARGSFQIWSAGCATGEEPYSILFTAIDTLGPARSRAMALLATDISSRALAVAQAGVYPAQRLKEMPADWPKKYLQRGTGPQQGSVRVGGQWRNQVRFARLNLMEDLSGVPRLSVIFCRNVMIYFDKPTQEGLIRRFAGRLEPGGWLLIGHSEGLMGIRHELEYVMPAVYRKPGGASR